MKKVPFLKLKTSLFVALLICDIFFMLHIKLPSLANYAFTFFIRKALLVDKEKINCFYNTVKGLRHILFLLSLRKFFMKVNESRWQIMT